MKIGILWILDGSGNILMAQRALHLDSDAGLWGPSISGQIEDNESAYEAMVREAQEELGLILETPTHLYTASHNHKDGEIRHMENFYLHHPTLSMTDISANADEVE